MPRLSYIVETNGENGVRLDYLELNYVPQNVVWDESNTFPDDASIPDVDDTDSPEYIKVSDNGGYIFYRRTVVMPAKSATFSLYLLVDGTQSSFTYDVFGSFLTTELGGQSLSVSSKTNVSGSDREATISFTDDMYGETLQVPVAQEYEPIRLMLVSYEYEDMYGDGEGDIMNTSYEHTFHWLTQKTSPDKETLSVEVAVSGPRNGFIVRDVSEYAYVSELNPNYIVSQGDGGVYETTQSCNDGETVTVSEPVVFDTLTQSVFKKVKYNNDLKIVRDGRFVKITNYGRCFLQSDAYYVITLANVDNLHDTCSITIRYENEEP